MDGLRALHGLPEGWILAVGSASLAYGAHATVVARRAQRPLPLIVLLAAANVAWMVACFAAVLAQRGNISGMGVAQLAGEGVYVGGLGVLEWRWREALTRRPRGAPGHS